MKRRLALVLLACTAAFATHGRAEKPPATVEQPRFDITTRRADSRIVVRHEGRATVLEIHSEFGIDRATVRRSGDHWPATMLVRLCLRGLESFRAGDGVHTVEWSVSIDDVASSRVTLWKGQQEQPLDPESPFWTAVRLQSAAPDHPQAPKHFEVPLPRELFRTNPREITLAWIDFYRG